MRQLTVSFLSAFVLTTVFVATAAADSHGTATGATTVTAVPRTGVGTIALSSSGGVILLLVVLAALMAFASIWQASRA